MKDQQIGHYKILEKLGAGGMGEVWLAEDIRLDRKVALKFLPHFASQDENEKARFIQEAKAAARLSHANIAQIYEIDEEDGRLYIVMEYVSGGSLRDLLDEAKGKSLPLEKVLTWVQQTAEGLAEAHSQGIIHRDIKPDNLMLTEKGQVKITDFGLARLETATRLTASGTTLGTVNYMSPELITGKDVDHRSDLFSLGATVFELLTDQQVFAGQDANSTYYAILNSPIDPLPRYRSDLLAGVEQLVSKLLERDVSLRYQAAAGVAADVRRILGSTERTVRRSNPILRIRQLGRRLIPILGWGIALYLLAIVGFQKQGIIDLSSCVYTPFATEAEVERHGAWSPDGTSIAYLKKIDGYLQVMVRRLDRITPTQITSMREGVFHNCRPIWSHDGTQLYFVADSSLWVISTMAGGSARLVLEGGVHTADLSPVDDVMVCWGSGGLTISQPIGTERVPYSPLPEEIRAPGSSPAYLRFSPDGKNIGLGYYSNAEVTQPSDQYLDLWLLPWPSGSGSGVKRPFPKPIGRINVPSFDWIDSEHLVLSGAFNIGIGIWIGDIRSGELHRITTGVVEEMEFAVSPDGRRILYSRIIEDFDLIEIPIDGSTPHRLYSTPQEESSPSYAGNRIAYLSGRGDQREIWIRELDGDGARPVVFSTDIPGYTEGLEIRDPVMLSPDGKSVAYIINPPGEPYAIWVSPIEGGTPAPAFSESIFPENRGAYSFSWSPDSRSLVGRSARGGVWAVVDVGDLESTKAIPYGGNTPLWSPRGDWIAGMSRDEITLVSPVSSVSRTIESPVSWQGDDVILSWSPTGDILYLISARPSDSGIYALDISTERIERVADLYPGVLLGTSFLSTQYGSMDQNGRSILTTERIFKSDLFILDGFPRPQR
ncbi:protein kinase [Gemmatimonadota bacterium]